jgi:hypothetical protein
MDDEDDLDKIYSAENISSLAETLKVSVYVEQEDVKEVLDHLRFIYDDELLGKAAKQLSVTETQTLKDRVTVHNQQVAEELKQLLHLNNRELLEAFTNFKKTHTEKLIDRASKLLEPAEVLKLELTIGLDRIAANNQRKQVEYQAAKVTKKPIKRARAVAY